MKKKICFVGLDVYPVLHPTMDTNYFGGESVQQTLLAKAFVELGYIVSIISYDYGQPDQETIEGITIYKTFSQNSGIPVIRYVHPRLTKIIDALKKADADIYFQSCAGMLTGVVAWFCKRNNRKFIFRIAHDTDCIKNQQMIPTWRDRKLYEYGIKNTTLVSAQGVKQVSLLQKNYAIHSVPINMVVERGGNNRSYKKEIDILWVNNIRNFKRPEWVLYIAKMLPQYQFTMIGGPVPGNENRYEELKKLAKKQENIIFLGAVPYQDINGYFDRCKVFINTSISEGFPNSFLQAWIRGVPIVSFFDPDGLIKSHQMGIVATDINNMTSALLTLLGDEKFRNKLSINSQYFASENYAPINIAKLYQQKVENIERK